MPYVYSCNSGEMVTITMDLQTSTGTSIKTFTATPVACTGVNTTTIYTMKFSAPIEITASDSAGLANAPR